MIQVQINFSESYVGLIEGGYFKAEQESFSEFKKIYENIEKNVSKTKLLFPIIPREKDYIRLSDFFKFKNKEEQLFLEESPDLKIRWTIIRKGYLELWCDNRHIKEYGD